MVPHQPVTVLPMAETGTIGLAEQHRPKGRTELTEIVQGNEETPRRGQKLGCQSETDVRVGRMLPHPHPACAKGLDECDPQSSCQARR